MYDQRTVAGRKAAAEQAKNQDPPIAPKTLRSPLVGAVHVKEEDNVNTG